MNFFEWCALAVCGVLLTVMLFVTVAMVPFALYAEKQCLKAGYPRSTTTFDFDYYCVTLDGETRGKVAPADDL